MREDGEIVNKWSKLSQRITWRNATEPGTSFLGPLLVSGLLSFGWSPDQFFSLEGKVPLKQQGPEPPVVPRKIYYLTCYLTRRKVTTEECQKTLKICSILLRPGDPSKACRSEARLKEKGTLLASLSLLAFRFIFLPEKVQGKEGGVWRDY